MALVFFITSFIFFKRIFFFLIAKVIYEVRLEYTGKFPPKVKIFIYDPQSSLLMFLVYIMLVLLRVCALKKKKQSQTISLCLFASHFEHFPYHEIDFFKQSSIPWQFVIFSDHMLYCNEHLFIT